MLNDKLTITRPRVVRRDLTGRKAGAVPRAADDDHGSAGQREDERQLLAGHGHHVRAGARRAGRAALAGRCHPEHLSGPDEHHDQGLAGNVRGPGPLGGRWSGAADALPVVRPGRRHQRRSGTRVHRPG
ncbi:hypothetical protein G6F22_020088 [Rhizopus arrhizus]|nr:hypothetical protein G6F22_020088 [Rhizopus arrhizus]